VIPAAFDYAVADSLEGAIELLSREDAKLLAGGHSLIPAMRLRVARPSLLVDIGRLDGLSSIDEDGDAIVVGALARLHDVANDTLLRERCDVMSKAASLTGDPQVRHRGTIGGVVAHADPASDLPTVLRALDADFVVRGPNGERTVAAGDFFQGVFHTALGPQDVLTAMRIPRAAGTYVKFNRRAQDWATVGVAIARVNGDVRVGLTSMGPVPLRATGVEQALASGADPSNAAERADEGTSPVSDLAGSADFRRHLARVLVRRALESVE
jgi:aerobic carbon-monoxide dehydrogenase medium subunit